MNREQLIQAGKSIAELRYELADKIMDEIYREVPGLRERYSAEDERKCKDDIMYHILYLSEAVSADSMLLFEEYLEWVKVLFNSLGVNTDYFLLSLKKIQTNVKNILPDDTLHIAEAFLEHGIRNFASLGTVDTSFISADNPYEGTARSYLDFLLAGKRHEASELILQRVQAGDSVKHIYLSVFQPVQHEIGRLWQTNRISVAQEHYCTAATQLIMSQLYPYIFNHGASGKVFVGTCVGNELHEIGIRMITDFFEMAGWDTYFIGSNTPVETVVETIVKQKTDVLGVSCTISYHIRHVRDLLDRLRNHSIGAGVKVIVGGYPFNKDPSLWKSVGADDYAVNAESAVETGEALIG